MTETITNQHDDILDDLLTDFLDASTSLLQSLNDNLLELETWVTSIAEEDPGPCDKDLMNEIFRSPPRHDGYPRRFNHAYCLLVAGVGGHRRQCG